VQKTPAILDLLAYLDQNAETIKTNPASVSPTVVRLLRETIAVLGGDQLLDELLAQIETSEPGSPAWKHAMAELTAELPLHARGEYRAKLAWSESAWDWQTEQTRLTTLSKAYLAQPEDSAERKQLHKQIHGELAQEAATCLRCHGDKPAMVDF